MGKLHSLEQCVKSCEEAEDIKTDHYVADTGSVINITTAYPFGHFIGSRYPYLPKMLVADTNPWWTNKTAVKADYAAGGVPPVYQITDWRPVYDALANGIVDGERTIVTPK